jgi:hypothetical protein
VIWEVDLRVKAAAIHHSREVFMSRQSLSFTVFPARTETQLRAACRVRALSYGRHLPGIASVWDEPDQLDRDPQAVVFVATSKVTGEPLGTVRLATNALQPTQIERSASVPHSISGGLMAEVTRLAVLAGSTDPAVKLGLMKAAYLHCLAHQVRWMVIGARSDALVRQYRRLGFTDLDDQAVEVPLAHAGGLPHRVLVFDVVSAERNWLAALHPFYQFMVGCYHPDIQIFAAPPETARPVPVEALAA